MTVWLDKLAKILALGLDTRMEPEQRAAFVAATALAARHRLSLGSAYVRLERSNPNLFRYLESKRQAAGIASFIEESDVQLPGAPSPDHYTGNWRARQAMLSCTVSPLSGRPRSS